MAQVKKETPHPIDHYVGQKLREARIRRGMSQQILGKRLSHPITFQQVQKYERGINRIAISRLHDFSVALELPITFFLPESKGELSPFLMPQEIELLKCFYAMPLASQTSLMALLKEMKRGI